MIGHIVELGHRPMRFLIWMVVCWSLAVSFSVVLFLVDIETVDFFGREEEEEVMVNGIIIVKWVSVSDFCWQVCLIGF